MNTLHLEIITPEKVVYTDEVGMVVVPGSEGNLGILPNHIPLFTKLKSGEIKVKKENEVILLAVSGGFVDVQPTKVTILADSAIRSEEIDEEKALAAKARAEELMKQKLSEKEFTLAEASLRRALAELRVAKRHKGRGGGLCEQSLSGLRE